MGLYQWKLSSTPLYTLTGGYKTVNRANCLVDVFSHVSLNMTATEFVYLLIMNNNIVISFIAKPRNLRFALGFSSCLTPTSTPNTSPSFSFLNSLHSHTFHSVCVVSDLVLILVFTAELLQYSNFLIGLLCPELAVISHPLQ